ncbi:hypothetical protein ASE12_14120 [Aeromicrobium sp. Root236]|uniref:ABC transporter permease n=1 Tax=Aeromicrobium sp. Root236 TaxID=1736498 RepID=UPI0006F7DAD7|nr:ABC transporter permease [Aeromicrobium sp. Root236]KRC65794.1 hypothetical protein ASE12_14120 [Aeromicrobium sp. Root236]
MARWLAYRIGGAAVTLFVASLVIYGALQLVPGDPVIALSGGRRLTPDQIETLREEFGLNRSFVGGYLHWLGGALHFDFGNSLQYGSSVTSLLSSRLAVSAVLIAYSATLTVVIGLAVALISAARGGVADRIGLYVSSITSAMPPFVSAVVLLSVFSVKLGWFPAVGGGEGAVDRIYHLTLPAVALAIGSFGVLARIGRATFLEELTREHVEVARSRGVKESQILRRHVFRNSLGPLATLIALLLSSLFVGTAVAETAFGLNGIGALLVQSVARRDLPVVQAIALVAVALFVVTSTVVDLLMPLIDPRVKIRKVTS